MPYEIEKKRLAKIAKELAKKYDTKLTELKKSHEDLARPDFIWHFLLQSFSTMGRSSGWYGLIGNQENYSKLTFDSLANLNLSERIEVVYNTCRVAQVRMPDKKAKFILGCFEHVNKLGGLESVNRILLTEKKGREEKINFLKTFPGIGPKYARNIMMDVYHEDFRNSIAIDTRIEAISSALGVSFSNYDDHEQFYLEVAQMAGINGWELDRLLYNFRSEFEDEIKNKNNSF